MNTVLFCLPNLTFPGRFRKRNNLVAMTTFSCFRSDSSGADCRLESTAAGRGGVGGYRYVQQIVNIDVGTKNVLTNHIFRRSGSYLELSLKWVNWMNFCTNFPTLLTNYFHVRFVKLNILTFSVNASSLYGTILN